MQNAATIAQTTLEKIREARHLFVLNAQNGNAIFMQGLKGSVGRAADNFPADLSKVQKRLVALEMLENDHEENPATLERPILSGSIPYTIEAIEYFQLRHQAEFWVSTPERRKLVGTSTYKLGKVNPQDITFKLLREFTEYELRFSMPNGKKIEVNFQNFPHTIFTQYYDGVSFTGKSTLRLNKTQLSYLQLPENALEAVLKVLGQLEKFDAVHSFGAEIFAFGILPFKATNGHLEAVLALMKHRSPHLFGEYFQRFGIDVTFKLQGNLPLASSAILQAINPDSLDQNHILIDKNAFLYLQKNKQLHGVFIRAGLEEKLAIIQAEALIRFYWQPIFSQKWHLDIGGHLFWNVSIKQLFQAPFMLATLLYIGLDKGIDVVKFMVKPALEQTAWEQQVLKEEDFSRIDMHSVLQKIITSSEQRRDYMLAKRLKKFLE